MPKKIENTRTLAREILMPLIKYCAARRGAMTEVLKLYNEGLVKPVTLTKIRRWMLENEEEWREPESGSLLHLLSVWKKIRGDDVVNWREQSIFCSANGCVPSRTGDHCTRCGREFQVSTKVIKRKKTKTPASTEPSH